MSQTRKDLPFTTTLSLYLRASTSKKLSCKVVNLTAFSSGWFTGGGCGCCSCIWKFGCAVMVVWSLTVEVRLASWSVSVCRREMEGLFAAGMRCADYQARSANIWEWGEKEKFTQIVVSIVYIYVISMCMTIFNIVWGLFIAYLGNIL